MCDGSSTGISMVSKPHFLNCGNSFVLSFVKGEVKRKVLIPNLIVSGDVMSCLAGCEAETPALQATGTFIFPLLWIGATVFTMDGLPKPEVICTHESDLDGL